ncbi:MAG: hypothetical protein NVSMB70_16580 [Chamaesiphon sp.]
MNKHWLQRRQLLWYFGLGVGTAALSLGYKKAVTTTFASGDTPIASTSGHLPNLISVAASTTGQLLPEFQGISSWLNSAPLKTADLKGKVVLIQFWTFACINCQRTLPYITRWHQQYAKSGLKVVGVHTPEFPFERDVNNVKRALKQHQIHYAVPLDNEFKTWIRAIVTILVVLKM